MRARRTFIVLVWWAATSASLARADWSQFQGNAGHTGYVAESVNAPMLSHIWSVPVLSTVAGNIPGVAMAGGKVYTTMVAGISLDGPYSISCLDAASGKPDWQRTIVSDSLYGVSAPTLLGGTVYVHRFGASDGSQSSYPNDYPALVGLDIRNGNQLFLTTHLGQWNSGSQPCAEGDAIFAAGGYYGGLDAYELNGSVKWTQQLPQQYGWSPAADVNNVYVYMGYGSGSPGPSVGTLFVVDRATGARRATITQPSSTLHATGSKQTVVLGQRGDAFALTMTGNYVTTLSAFDLANKRVKWEMQGLFSSNPAVANGLIVIDNQYSLRFLDQETGTVVGSWTSPSPLSGNVVLTDTHAFVSSSDGVYAIDLQTRQPVWSAPGFGGNLVFDRGLLLVSNKQGIHAFAVVPEPGGLGLACGTILLMRRCRRRRGSGV